MIISFKKSAGITDKQTGQVYLDHLQFWQDETERQSLTISDLKAKITQLEESSKDQQSFLTQVLEERKGGVEITTPGLTPAKTSFVKVESPAQNKGTETKKVEESTKDLILITTETGQSSVKAGTIGKLVARLLDASVHDTHFVQTFLLNYQAFCEPHQLLGWISESFKPEAGADPNKLPRTLKAVNVLKYWIEQYWNDFSGDEALRTKLTAHITGLDNAKLAQMLRTTISRKIANTEASVIEMPTDCPKAILPKSIQKKPEMLARDSMRPSSMSWASMGSNRQDDSGTNLNLRLKLVDLDPLEMARQLTLIEFDLFCKIKPREFVGLSWMKDDKEVRAPNIIKMVRWSNHVIQWLVTEIVSLKDNIKARASMMERIITIAKHCNTLNNFNGVKEILAALQSSAVYRLKKTREVEKY